jgi:hypothetical protein
VRAAGPATDRGITRGASTGQERMARVARQWREGNRRPWPQGGGAGPHERRGRRGALRAARGAGQAGRVPGAPAAL